jgi:hypothetical protein
MASNPPQTLRLTFAWQGARVRLIGSERVAMIAPGALTTPPEPGQTGYWFEVHDAAGKVIYRRPLHKPIRTDVEAFSPDARPSIARVPVATTEGRFTLLIPDIADAQTFALHGPADPARADEPAQELVRIDVDALRRFKPSRGTPP